MMVIEIQRHLSYGNAIKYSVIVVRTRTVLCADEQAGFAIKNDLALPVIFN